MTRFSSKIERDFPFRQVSDAVEREKSLRKGHPSALHPWPGRQPMAIVDAVLECIDKGCHALLDPFCGSGMTGFAARKTSYSRFKRCLLGDVDPLAVFLSRAAMGFTDARASLPPDVRRFGEDVIKRTKKALEPLYLVGDEPVTGWIWARTVQSPCPDFAGVHVPLMNSFVLSRKKGMWLEPVVEGDDWRFEVRRGEIPADARKGLHYKRGGDFRCVLSGMPITRDYVEAEFQAGRGGMRMVAVMLDDGQGNGHSFRAATREEEARALGVRPENVPDSPIAPGKAKTLFGRYGMARWSDLFTPRQVAALMALVREIRATKDVPEEGFDLDGPVGERAMADAFKDVDAALMLAVSRAVNRNSTLGCLDVRANKECVNKAFQHDEFRMSWDFVEAYPFNGGPGDFRECILEVADALEACCRKAGEECGTCWGCLYGYKPSCLLGADEAPVRCVDVVRDEPPGDWADCAIVTELPVPGVSEAEDVKDFFYFWLREGLRSVWPEEFATLATPKGRKVHGYGDLKAALERLKPCQKAGTPAVFSFRVSRDGTGGSLADMVSPVLADLADAGWMVTAMWPVTKENTFKGEDGKDVRERTLTDVVVSARVHPGMGDPISRQDFRRLARAHGAKALKAQGGAGADGLCESERMVLALGAAFRALDGAEWVLKADGTPADGKVLVADALSAVENCL